MAEGNHPKRLGMTLATGVAGEDVLEGDFVTITQRTIAVPAYFWDSSDSWLRTEQLVRLRLIPHDAGLPVKVIAICLPFVYARRPNRTIQVIDLRREEISKLEADRGKRIWREMQVRKDSCTNVD
jgi:hypothetical protein